MFNRQKKIIALLLVIGLIGISFGITPKTSFASNKYSRCERLELLRSNAYCVVSVIPGNSKGINLKNKAEVRKDNEMSEDYYLALSDKEFEKELRESIMSVIRRQSKGEKIIWSKPFLERKLKPIFPDLYKEVIKASRDNPAVIKVKGIKSIDSGSRDLIEYSHYYSAMGLWVFSFYSEQYWAWYNNRITNVRMETPWGVVNPLLGWQWNGTLTDSGYYYNNYASYHRYIMGKFSLELVGPPFYQYRYPWHNWEVHAGGECEFTSGEIT